ncbi:TPA: hypothetical protein DDZ10_02490 [Candidatus Uhrbacteria bacterium]|nr:MAG: UvrD/REP helicase [Parcubacteria group bacterium GW2011_GWA2_53_21]HBL39517.1 hypothetical protein [Candidatus Uhrbacteria bacterium]
MHEFILQGTRGSSRLRLEEDLNDEQRCVVLEGDGPCLVLAGAGSGKTRTITYRVAYLIEQGISPDRLLLLTFTNKASAEMISRVESLCGRYPTGLWAGTFHSVANRLLRQYASEVGFTRDFTILDREDSEALIKTCVKDQKIDTKKMRFPSASVILALVSYARNAGVSFEEALERKHPHLEPVLADLLLIATLYDKKKRAGNTMDFDDLLLKLLELLNDHPAIADRLSERFKYILVDEFQDTNTIQAAIIRRLAQQNGNLLVVGDDAQSIYSFRAADIQNILRFPEWMPRTKTFRLTSNYRSTPEILSLANASIEHNEDQFEKELRPMCGDGEKPCLVPAQNTMQEARYIAEQVLELLEEGRPLREIAVLFRSSFHSQQLELELSKRNIPYEYRGGLRFFERAHIKDLVAYLRLFSNVRDEVAWMRVLGHQPGIGLVTAGNIYDAIKNSATLTEALRVEAIPKRGLSGWRGVQKIIRPLLSEMLPSTIIRGIVVSDYQDYLESQYPDYHDRLEDLEQFALFAEQYSDVSSFLSEVTLKDDYGAVREEGEEERDRMVLSTIHQAKGLEWDSVFVMRLSEGSFPHKRSLEDTSAFEEERRLFYVAATRARRRLFLTYALSSGFDTLAFHQPSTFIEEVPRRLFEEVRLKDALPIREASSKDGGYEEPTIVLDDAGERTAKPMPKSFLGNY